MSEQIPENDSGTGMTLEEMAEELDGLEVGDDLTYLDGTTVHRSETGFEFTVPIPPVPEPEDAAAAAESADADEAPRGRTATEQAFRRLLGGE